VSERTPAPAAADRRRVDRRSSERIADLTLPEFRRIVVTTLIATAVGAAFLWMVRTVIVAGILGAVIAAYLRPLYELLRRRTGRPSIAALLALAVVAIPAIAVVAYSYVEIVRVAQYLADHQAEVTERINQALSRLLFMQGVDSGESVRNYVIAASDYGANVPKLVRHALSHFSVATTIFLFTAFYIFTKGERVSSYLRAQVPPRYAEFIGALERNLRAVLYGAVYATFVTQLLKSAVIFLMNVAFGVPLAGVLAALAFVIGFFPIVGSWSVYIPVALWLLVFRDAPVRAGLMIAIGTLLNTLFISMYLRPKLAADRSRVLDFYWMFVGLITGVYTFGLAGIILGPILIGLLKAVVDTVTAQTSWQLLDADGDVVEAGA
jgi:predicted PurR-regulated permease PerM